MATLCIEAEEYLKKHNKKLSEKARANLATRDPKAQVQWLVNPMVMFLLERTMNDIWKDLYTHKSAKPAAPPVVSKPKNPNPNTEPEPDTDPEDEGELFDLFGD